VDDLVAGLDELDLESSAAIGCVYVMTHGPLVARRARMSGVRVVIDKARLGITATTSTARK
jgi:hypothetical protein